MFNPRQLQAQFPGAQGLDTNISLYKLALSLTPIPSPMRPPMVSNLAVHLLDRFEKQGDARDLDEAISLQRDLLRIRPPSSPERPTSLSNMGVLLWTRFQHHGNEQDLDESVLLLRQAVQLTPPPHPVRSKAVGNLGVALWMRFMHRVDNQDLEESILLHKEALKRRPPSHPDRPFGFSNLGLALGTRFRQYRNARDLNESILFHRQAVKLFPAINRSGSLNNLALALMSRFEEHGDLQDIDEAISLHRQAVELRPPPHSKRTLSLHNLALALAIRGEQRGNDSDLDESILSHRQAVVLQHPSHPGRPISLETLAKVLLVQYKRRGDASHLNESMILLSEAARSISQSSSQRFRRARSWAHHANMFQHRSALEAFDTALGILPELAALGLDVQSRQDSLLNETDGLAREAAGCAIRAGNSAKAVEFLETGRSVFWSQFLTLRSPFDQLAEVAPELAMDLRTISKQLDAASYRDKSIENTNNQQKLSWEQEAKWFEQLATQWNEIVDRVRCLNGFEDFLRPQLFSKLRDAAKRGPVVYLVANEDTSNCLIMTSTLLHHIPLPILTNPVLLGLVKIIQAAVSEHQISRSFIEETVNIQVGLPQHVVADLQRWIDEDDDRGMRLEQPVRGLSSDNLFGAVLRFLWEQAIKPIIDFLELKKSTNPPTVTWCTTGLFTLLPVHAAGCYVGGYVDCASDYFISSYTPTIGTMLTPIPPPLEPFKMMVVIQSQTLPSTRKELAKIEQYVAADSLIKIGTAVASASVEAVASRLSAASIVHFACHGIQNPTNPLQSGLEIENKILTISRIMKETIPNSSLAFLSACETAMGDEKIPDEAMSIAASLLFIGFRGVVATMWRMWDEDGPIIADTFYRELFKGLEGNPTILPDTSKSAEALAAATKELRGRGVPFKRWVPFIHMGQ
ncbi:hypothetical protein GALMADRAFT_445475 [Galerina marginata CBS 339.88]|uniref:CHAT domain-containing protein n=1 Tax=Galerina marginata (strain CBS 339.88) TaxID=685588 RepID=A0A067T2D0_GALM3|nr:hypothetical protein GALMADRAFT_445475 [Galerina marginata CBS 339.88]